MSFQAIEEVFTAMLAGELEIGTSDLMVLTAIAFHANDELKAFPGHVRLAAMTGISPRSVGYRVKQLTERGLLDITKRRRAPAVYRITLPGTQDRQASATQTKTKTGNTLPLSTKGQDRQERDQDRQERVAKTGNSASRVDVVNQLKEPTKEPTTTGRGAADDDRAVVVDATDAMTRRGIVNPDELFAFATPEAIVDACRWFDRQRNVGPGLLAKMIRQGGVQDGLRAAEQDAARFQNEHPCDLDSPAACAWDRVLDSLNGDSLALWLAGSHPHADPGDGPLIIGVKPGYVQWLRARLTTATRSRLAGGRELEIHGCPRLDKRRDDELVDEIKREFDATELSAHQAAQLDGAGVSETWDFTRDDAREALRSAGGIPAAIDGEAPE